MPVKFIVEEDALLASNSDIYDSKLSHQRFLEYWMQSGVYVDNSDGYDLAETVCKMPQQFRVLWQSALKSGSLRRTRASLGPPDVLFSSEASILKAAEVADLGCLEDTRVACLCTEDGATSRFYPEKNFEICNFAGMDQTQSFRREVEKWRRPIGIGEDRTSLWTDRFADLCLYARTISIVDRYAGKEMVNCFDKGSVCGLGKFLGFVTKLDLADQRKKIVNLYVSALDLQQSDISEILRKIVPTGQKNIASLNLYVGDDHVFQQFAHGRALRFDHTVVSLDSGISLFEFEKTKRTFDCFMKFDTEGWTEKEIERKLRSQSSRFVIL